MSNVNDAPPDWQRVLEETTLSGFWTRTQNTRDYMDFVGWFHRSSQPGAKEVKAQLTFVKKRDGGLDNVYIVFTEEYFNGGSNEVVGGEFEAALTFKAARRILESWKSKKIPVREAYWTENPKYPLSDWQHEVANNDTRLSYHEWCEHKREDDEARRV